MERTGLAVNDSISNEAGTLPSLGFPARNFITFLPPPNERKRGRDATVPPDREGRSNRFSEIKGQSEPMQHVFSLIEKVAPHSSTVLITGESGTGKELVAKAIHRLSPRSKRRFIPINCGAIPENLLESELFGHVKGAFTGATAGRPGRFALADGGTVFLDEIGDMSPSLQVKLLRVLQEHEFEEVGGTRTIKVDIRVIAATNQDLAKAVEEGRFRRDLYYRLKVIPINVKPLKERKSDIPVLVDYFVLKFNEEKRMRLKGFTSEAMEILVNYCWPGNVRELENLVERLVILIGEEKVTPADLVGELEQDQSGPALSSMTLPVDGLCFKSAVTEFENALIHQALARSNGNKNKAANLLKLNRTTLVEKLKRKRIDPVAVTMSA